MFVVWSFVHELLLLGCCCYLCWIPFAVEKSQFCLCCIWDSSPPLFFFFSKFTARETACRATQQQLSRSMFTSLCFYTFSILCSPQMVAHEFFFFFAILLNMHLSEFNSLCMSVHLSLFLSQLQFQQQTSSSKGTNKRSSTWINGDSNKWQ